MKHAFTHSARRCAPMILLLASSLTASADVIYSNLQDLAIPTTFDGIYLDVETGANDTTGTIDWDLNLIFGGVGVFNSIDFQPVRETDAGNGTLSNLSSGTIVNASLTFDSSDGTGASIDHMGDTFTAGAEGTIGFQLNSGNYGWMRVVLDGSGSAFIKDWAYDDGGGSGAIATSNVLQSGSSVTVDSSFGSFTLGSALTGSQSLAKTGSGTTTLSADSTNSGTTTVSSGMLLVNSDNSAATGSVSVESGATLGGSGIIGGDTTIQLGGTLAAGNSPGILSFEGDLTLGTGSLTVIEILGTTRGSEYDAIDVDGLFTYGGALALTSDTLVAHGVYDLLGVVTENSNFASIILSGTAYTNNAFTQFGDVWTVTVGGDTYTFSQLTGDLSVVPEPVTYALIGGMFALVYVMLRRRR